jgi:hypothetical protein
MKKALMVLCFAIALVGCNQNRGGMGDASNRDTGSSSGRDTIYPSSESSTLNRNDSSILLTNTNSIVPAPAEPEAVKPDQGGTDYYKDSDPKN